MKKTKTSLKSSKNYTLQKIKDDEGEELIYVINFNEGGFILMPTDNRVNPILAFSENNFFDTENIDNANGLSLWMDGTKKGIKSIKKSKELQSKEMNVLWERQLKNFSLKDGGIGGDPPCEDSEVTKGPLLSTDHDQWSQTALFNLDCPTEAQVEAQCGCDCDFSEMSGHAYAGCAPVAMGMIMCYYQYPNTYNWSLMPDQLGNSYAANLLSNIGTQIGVEYKCTGSSIRFNWQIILGFSSFGYSSYGTIITYNYTNNFGTIQYELNANRPVILSGINSENKGHSWICDGYKVYKICIDETYFYESHYHHMNYGENRQNGFYWFGYFDGYDNDLHLIYGIHP